MKIPKQFQLLGRTWTVRVIPKKEWTDPDAVGICDCENCEIRLLKQKTEAMQHVLLHEYMHAVLAAMNSKLYSNEQFVDTSAGLLHQILTTGK